MKLLPLTIAAGILISACHQPGAVQRERQGDSTEVVKLLRSAYEWHDKNQANWPDFPIITNDSFQVGINYDSLNKTINGLKQTGYFSSAFMANYRKLADAVNTKLTTANPKLLNEVNFGFQDADPWTYFQDSAGEYWNKMTISDFKLNADSASLTWKIRDLGWNSEPYAVGFFFENGKWRVAYLQGYDLKSQ